MSCVEIRFGLCAHDRKRKKRGKWETVAGMSTKLILNFRLARWMVGWRYEKGATAGLASVTSVHAAISPLARVQRRN